MIGARRVEQRLKKAAEVAEALVQSRNARDEARSEKDRKDHYVGKHRAF